MLGNKCGTEIDYHSKSCISVAPKSCSCYHVLNPSSEDSSLCHRRILLQNFFWRHLCSVSTQYFADGWALLDGHTSSSCIVSIFYRFLFKVIHFLSTKSLMLLGLSFYNFLFSLVLGCFIIFLVYYSHSISHIYCTLLPFYYTILLYTFFNFIANTYFIRACNLNN